MQFPHIFLVSLSTVVFLFLCPPTASADAPLYPMCGTTNFTANSTYQTNLNTLFGSLTINATNSKNFGFASGMVGSVPNQISGLVLCRGDVNSSTCSSCLSQASQDVQNLCPYNREATIWYDFCFLRYSNQHFLGSLDDSQLVFLTNTQNITGSIKLFNSQVHNLMNATSDYAAFNNSKKFGTAEMNTTTPVPALYGLVQCTTDLSRSDCVSCLSSLIGQLANSANGKQGGRVLALSCNVRYEIYPFYQGTPILALKASEATSPAPAPALVLPPPVVNPPTTGKKKNTTGTILAITIPVVVAFMAILSLCVCFVKRQKTKLTRPLLNLSNPEEIQDVESLLLDLSVLRVATINFANENKLGEGGFGSVYKGVMPDGREIAVKRLSQTSGQGIGELKNELLLVAKLQHKNLARLLGVCLEDQEKMLVYEYMPNKSLDKILFDAEKKQRLDWAKRHKIITGVARGLLYLHEDSQLRIIHRDLKASNVLLDADMSPKISDFGLARLFGGDQTQDVTNRVVGTYGYMAPEYAMRGLFSIKSDVFSYGVLVLEIISGRRNSGTFNTEESEADLLSFVWEHWINGTITDVTDPSLGQNYPTSEVLRCIQIAILCVQDNPCDRPTMSNVAVMLSSETVSLDQPSRPAFCIGSNGMRAGSFSNMSNSVGSNYIYERSSKSVETFSPNEVSITDVEAR